METIVNKIKRSVQSGTGLTCLYGSLDDINVQMGDQTDFPVAFFVLLNNGSLDDRSSNYRERVDVAMFFVKPTEFDFESIENEAIISECKQCAFQWLNSLFLGGDLRYITTLNTSRVYNQMDDILTGYALRVRLEELVGECAPEPFRPNRTVTVTSNDDNLGTVTGGGEYRVGDTVTLTASEIAPAEFINWTVNGVEVSTSEEYTFTVTKDVSVTGNFAINYLRFTSLSDNGSVGWNGTYPNLEYSKNGGDWTSFTETISNLNTNDYVEFRNNGTAWKASNYNSRFNTTGTFNLSGNIMSLVDNTLQSKTIPIVSCFKYIFRSNGIVYADNLKLPATTLSHNCYESMFQGCTALRTAPKILPATLNEANSQYCYHLMFYGCSSLTEVPELPSETVSLDCYCEMFGGCTSITQAPVLPATTLVGAYCYASMFYGCTSLTQAPELPATTLSQQCYNGMFSGCTSLTQAPELPAMELIYLCYRGMFSGCTSLTTPPELPATTLGYGCYDSMFSGCTSLTQAPELPATRMVMECYRTMFAGCTSLTQAPELPATTLSVRCYNGMFNGCTGITHAPELPVTTMFEGCYAGMFYGCTALTDAPELPATTMALTCYMQMFYGCTSLTQAPELPAETLADICYASMFQNCTSLTQAPELPATTVYQSCYSSMFYGCTSLTQAPELPATTLEYGCYSRMFYGCQNIDYIKCMALYISENSTKNWLYNVSATGTFVKNPSMNDWTTGIDGIPSGWTVVENTDN